MVQSRAGMPGSLGLASSALKVDPAGHELAEIKVVAYKSIRISALLKGNLRIYGFGVLIVPFYCIKVIDSWVEFVVLFVEVKR
jgi:hypothetical protein